MFSFLNNFFLDLKKKNILFNFNVISYNAMNYNNLKISSSLIIFMVNLYNLVEKKIIILNKLFFVEIIFKRWLSSLLLFLIIFLFI
jgi:hypothetical protein